jgi:hypothetical protein
LFSTSFAEYKSVTVCFAMMCCSSSTAEDLWLKEIAPSTELRKWFHAATPDHWQEFKERYLTK